MLINIFDKDMSYKLSTHKDWQILIFCNPRLLRLLACKVCLHDLEYEFFDERLEEIEEREGDNDKEKEERLEKKKRMSTTTIQISKKKSTKNWKLYLPKTSLISKKK